MKGRRSDENGNYLGGRREVPNNVLERFVEPSSERGEGIDKKYDTRRMTRLD